MTRCRTRYEAFTECVLPELEVIRRVARSLTGQPADADDLVQDTLLRAFLAIDRFDGSHPRAWLLTILRNAERNRHRRKRPRLLDDPSDAVAEFDSQQASPSAEQLVVDATFEADVERAFQELPTHHRQIVILVDLHGLGYAEAAETLGVPVGTVMSRLFRARTHIRRQLGQARVALATTKA